MLAEERTQLTISQRLVAERETADSMRQSQGQAQYEGTCIIHNVVVGVKGKQLHSSLTQSEKFMTYTTNPMKPIRFDNMRPNKLGVCLVTAD